MRNLFTAPRRLGLRLVALWLGLITFSCAPGLVFAQVTPLAPPLITWGNNQTQLPGPVAIVGRDAVSGLPCIIGGQGSCTLGGVPFVRDYEVSAANTAQTFTYALGSIHDTLSIAAVCSAGSATLAVASSPDNSHFIPIDSIAAAAVTAKLYASATAGGSTAVSPLSFPYLQVTVGACGAGNTSTLYVGAN